MPQLEEIMASGVPWLAALNIAKIPAGAGVGTMNDQGNIFAANMALTSPAGLSADTVMASFTIPPLTFDIANRGMVFEAYGGSTSSANAKVVKIIVGCTAAVVGSAVSGGTTIATIPSFTTITGGWFIGAQVFKYGITGSNTQIATHFAGQVGGTAQALTAPTALTLTENAGILCAVTLNVAVTASDLQFCTFICNMMN
jgi:hypothetical protein